MSTLASVIQRGTLASRPAASIAGRLYYDTTNSAMARDNGSSWDSVAENGIAFMGARAIRTTTQSINSTTTTAIGMDSETSPGFDTNTIHDTVTNNSRFTVPTGGAGKWAGFGGGIWDTNASGNRYLSWRLNGTTDIPGSADLSVSSSVGLNQQAGFGPIVLADADYVEMVCYQDSGGARTIGAGSLGVGSLAASVYRVG